MGAKMRPGGAECDHQGHRNLSSVICSFFASVEFLFLPVGGRHRRHRFRRKRASSPAALFEQPPEILPSRNHVSLTIDAPEEPQAKASHAMPLFAFGKQRFDPDTAFAVRLLVRFGCVVFPDPIQILLMHTATEATSLFTGRTLRFERAGIAV